MTTKTRHTGTWALAALIGIAALLATTQTSYAGRRDKDRDKDRICRDNRDHKRTDRDHRCNTRYRDGRRRSPVRYYSRGRYCRPPVVRLPLRLSRPRIIIIQPTPYLYLSLRGYGW